MAYVLVDNMNCAPVVRHRSAEDDDPSAQVGGRVEGMQEDTPSGLPDRVTATDATEAG